MKLKIFLTFIVLLAICLSGLILAYNRGVVSEPTKTPEVTKIDEVVPPVSNNVIPEGNPRLKKEVKVDLSVQKAYLFENGKLVQEYTVSSGKADTPTPIGHFSIGYKAPKIFSKIAQCWLSYWAGFTTDGKYGFHETPVCDGVREGEDTMGQAASAGCLRLKLGDAEKFYQWIEVGVGVTVQ